MTTTTQPMDDEIDLRELGAALKRRWLWLVGCTVSGLAIGGMVGLKLSEQVKLSMFVDLANGPSSPLSASLDRSDSMGPYIVTSYQQRYQQEAAVLLLRNLLLSSKATPENIKYIKIAEPDDRDLKSESLIEVRATVPSAQASRYQALFEDLKHSLLRIVEKELLPADVPARSNFVHSLTLRAIPKSSVLPLALGGLVGLVFGAGAGLLADRSANRVFSAARLQQILGYPVFAILASQPWVDLMAQAELGQLRQQLDPSLHWKILSIANHHPCVEPLAAALKLPSAAPLLTHTLNAFTADNPGAVLLVVEPGFNSALALEKARRTLELLPGLEQTALILIQNRALPEVNG
jgi:hypothetical protein